MLTGVVKMYAPDRGFGFITADEAQGSRYGVKEFFVGRRALLESNLAGLRAGDAVEFDIRDSRQPGKVEAFNIKAVQAAAPAPVRFGG